MPRRVEGDLPSLVWGEFIDKHQMVTVLAGSTVQMGTVSGVTNVAVRLGKKWIQRRDIRRVTVQ